MAVHLDPNYPRSQPYPASQLLVAREARLRRWTVGLAVCTLAAVAVTLTAAYQVWSRTNRKTDSVESRLAATDWPPFPPPVSTGEKQPTATDPNAFPSPSSAPAGLPVSQREHLLAVLGGLTGAHLHESYLNICLLADAWENDIYSDEQARDLLTKVAARTEKVERQLAELGKTALNAEDQQALTRARALLGLLRTQAKELQAYWVSGAKEDADRYLRARARAWTDLNDLFPTSK